MKPDSPELWGVARRLIEEYAASLGVDLCFQNFGHEIESLPNEYGPPDGCFFLARLDDAFIACGALRRFSDVACEMKRLYVAPSGRGLGIGRALAEALVAEARRLGYDRVLLDTLPSMQAAQQLYASLGFAPAASYRSNPVPGATFLELQLR